MLWPPHLFTASNAPGQDYGENDVNGMSTGYVWCTVDAWARWSPLHQTTH